MKDLQARCVAKMIEESAGNVSDIAHFLKVYAYASTIARLEALDSAATEILEIAAIVHDIACPLCREKYGDTAGHHQEAESEALLRPFLKEFALEPVVENRIVDLVSHHHTYSGVDGMDYQILLEADFLVNAAEKGMEASEIRRFRDRVFRTGTGLRLLNSIFGL